MGKKIRRNQRPSKVKQIRSPATQHPTQPSVIPPNNPWSKKLPSLYSFIAALLLGLGFPIMSTGSGWAPWLISIGFLVVASILVIDDDMRRVITNIIKIKWLRVMFYIFFCSLSFVVPFILSQNAANDAREIKANTAIFYGELIPDNQQNPVPSEYVPDNAITLLLGDDLTIFAAETGNYILAQENRPFLSIGTDTNGYMVINAEVYDSTNHNVVRIIDNEFQANPEYAFKPKQPDKHSLVVRDAKGIEVLNVQCINPRVIRIVGRFYFSGYTQPVLILPSGIIQFPNGAELGHLAIDMTNITGGLINLGSQGGN
jgi:hypothetical protein